jgi:hypothetical protein
MLSQEELNGYFSGSEDSSAHWLLMLTAYVDESGPITMTE